MGALQLFHEGSNGTVETWRRRLDACIRYCCINQRVDSFVWGGYSSATLDRAVDFDWASVDWILNPGWAGVD
jgi:hypothetical protein